MSTQLSPEAKLERAREIAKAISAEDKADPYETEDEDVAEDARNTRDVSEDEDDDNKSDEGEDLRSLRSWLRSTRDTARRRPAARCRSRS